MIGPNWRARLAAGLAIGALGIAACAEDEDEPAATIAAEGEQAGQEAALTAAEQAAVEGYRAFATRNAEQHLDEFERFAAALEAGDIAEAKRIYPEARVPWERIEPVAGLFGDLDPALDAREGDVPPETWGGWHFFEQSLWVDDSTKGLEDYIAETAGDARTLVEAAETVEMTPADVAAGAVGLLDEVSATKITGEEERYSHTDLWDFQANVEGSEAAFDAVVPLVSDRALVAEIRARFAALERTLDGYRRGDGFVNYEQVGEAERRELSRLVDATAEPLSQVPAEVG